MAILYTVSEIENQIMEVFPENGTTFTIGEIVGMIGRNIISIPLRTGKFAYLSNQHQHPIDIVNVAFFQNAERTHEEILRWCQLAPLDRIKANVLVCSRKEAGERVFPSAICDPLAPGFQERIRRTQEEDSLL